MPQAVALSGVRPQISDLMAPQPPIRVPPNVSYCFFLNITYFKRYKLKKNRYAYLYV